VPIVDHTINGEDNSLRTVAKTVPGLLAVLLLGAIIYYKERMLFIDAPHVFFRIVNDRHLHIEEHRIGSFITQMFPLIGSELHIPFKLLLILYSASFYLFYLVVALLLVYRYRVYEFAVLMGLYFTLFVSETFFWPNNEVHQGITWLFFSFAVSITMAIKKRSHFISILVFTVLFGLAIWTHPLVPVIAVFLWFFLWSDKKYWPFSRSRSFIFTGILLALAGAKYYQGMHGGYDGSKMEMVTLFEPGKFKAVFFSPQFQYFIKGCFYNYWLFLALFVAGLVAMILQKRFLQLGWTIVVAMGYVLLVCITFWDISSGRFYLESEYTPLTIICCTPFVMYVLPALKTRIGVAIVLLIFAVRLGYIFDARTPFINRVAIMDNMLNKMKEKNIKKLIISEPEQWIDSALVMNWGAPVESIFLSKLKGEEPQRTFIFVAPQLARFTYNVGKDTLLSSWEKRTLKSINKRYFLFDTTSDYSMLSYDELVY
jgi:hypothetical protein